MKCVTNLLKCSAMSPIMLAGWHFLRVSGVKNPLVMKEMQEGWGRSPGGENDNSLQYSFQENPVDRNPMDRGAWWGTVHRVTKSRARLSEYTHMQDSSVPRLTPLDL